MFLYAHHVTYAVYSIREMADYLRKNFNMEPWKVDDKAELGMRTLIYRCGETMCEFVEPHIDAEGNPQVDHAACRLFANLLRETGPGLFHVAWGVENIDDLYNDLIKKGNKMDGQGHVDDNGKSAPLHDSVHQFFKVFNIVPSSIGTSFENSVRGVFFQCAEGKPGPAELADKGNLDITTLAPRSFKKPGGILMRDLGDVG